VEDIKAIKNDGAANAATVTKSYNQIITHYAEKVKEVYLWKSKGTEKCLGF